MNRRDDAPSRTRWKLGQNRHQRKIYSRRKALHFDCYGWRHVSTIRDPSGEWEWEKKKWVIKITIYQVLCHLKRDDKHFVVDNQRLISFLAKSVFIPISRIRKADPLPPHRMNENFPWDHRESRSESARYPGGRRRPPPPPRWRRSQRRAQRARP